MTQGGLGSQIGPIVFNYAYVVTLPSWINEMKPGLSVNKQLWGALIPGIATFIVLGWFSAAFYQTEPGIPDSEDLLSGLTGPSISKFAQAASFVFPPAALISGDPEKWRHPSPEAVLLTPGVRNAWQASRSSQS